MCMRVRVRLCVSTNRRRLKHVLRAEHNPACWARQRPAARRPAAATETHHTGGFQDLDHARLCIRPL